MRDDLPYSYATCWTCWASSLVGASTRHWRDRTSRVLTDKTVCHTAVQRFTLVFGALQWVKSALTMGPSPLSRYGWWLMWTIAGRRYYTEENERQKQLQNKKETKNKKSCGMVLISSVQFLVLLIWGIWHFEGNPLWSVGLTASVFPEPVWAIPTMSWPLRATGKPWAWIAVGSLKFCCIRTSITYSVTIKRGVFSAHNLHLIISI